MSFLDSPPTVEEFVEMVADMIEVAKQGATESVSTPHGTILMAGVNSPVKWLVGKPATCLDAMLKSYSIYTSIAAALGKVFPSLEESTLVAGLFWGYDTPEEPTEHEVAWVFPVELAYKGITLEHARAGSKLINSLEADKHVTVTLKMRMAAHWLAGCHLGAYLKERDALLGGLR